VRGAFGPGRALALAIGVILVSGGLGAVPLGASTAPSGVWMLLFGLVLIVASIMERMRYRSETAERSGLPIGPGGGEPTTEPLDTRFQATDEVFIDPTSNRRMRVWLDRTSGERRYRAED
jgi:hypothetical protein